MRILALDYGTRRVGLALSDSDRKFAAPLPILHRTSRAADVTAIKRIIEEEDVGQLLVGLPVHMSGQEGQKAKEAREFGDWIGKETGLPVVYWDERYSTADAEAHLLDAGLSKKKRKNRLDSVAARLILQSFLDAGCPDGGDFRPIEDGEA